MAAAMRLEQRGAVAFTLVSLAIAVILLITLWGYPFQAKFVSKRIGPP